MNIFLTQIFLQVFQILKHNQCQPVILSFICLSFRLRESLSRLHAQHFLNQTQPCHHLTGTNKGRDPVPDPVPSDDVSNMEKTKKKRRLMKGEEGGED